MEIILKHDFSVPKTEKIHTQNGKNPWLGSDWTPTSDPLVHFFPQFLKILISGIITIIIIVVTIVIVIAQPPTNEAFAITHAAVFRTPWSPQPIDKRRPP